MGCVLWSFLFRKASQGVPATSPLDSRRVKTQTPSPSDDPSRVKPQTSSPDDPPNVKTQTFWQNFKRHSSLIIGGITIFIVILLILFLIPSETPRSEQTSPDSIFVDSKQDSVAPAVFDRPRADQDENPDVFEAWQLFYAAQYNRIRASIVAIPFIIFIGWFAWDQYNRKPFLEKRQTRSSHTHKKMYIQGVDDLLFHTPSFQRLAWKLHLHREVSTNHIDDSATVDVTIRAAGFPQLQYKKRPVLPEYLILIDRSTFRDQQAEHSNAIVGRLNDYGIHVDAFYFRRDPRRLHSWKSDSDYYDLDELSSKYPSHRVIVCTDGEGLIHPISGWLHKWVAKEFSSWQNRAILTPVDPKSWRYREWSLSEAGLMVLPATTAGLTELIEVIHEVRFPEERSFLNNDSYPEILRDRPARWMLEQEPDDEIVKRLLKQMEIYLGEDTFYWLSACA
ncbi:MAG: hypothetical protein B6244_01115 [Candidatus Cloacimonetes bacterium 4572_55]|nr:MAG: hypothetical protein B6244_01115 [Candidatus Cloacimonetes bacterium 4572_55]